MGGEDVARIDFGNDFVDMRNNVTAATNLDNIADIDVIFFDQVIICQGGKGDDGTGYLDGFDFGYRGDSTHRTGLPVDGDEFGLVCFTGKFVGKLTFGALVFGSELLLDFLIVNFDNQTIDVVVVILAFILEKFLVNCFDLIEVLTKMGFDRIDT